MIRLATAVILALLSVSPASASIFADRQGDKLLGCQLKRFAEVDPQANDVDGGATFAVFVPVARKGEFLYREGRERVASTNIQTFDPAGIFGPMKINIYIDQADRSAFVAGMAIAPKPLMLLLDPNQRQAERYFAIVVPVSQGSLHPSGEVEWVGWCSVTSGETARKTFEALK